MSTHMQGAGQHYAQAMVDETPVYSIKKKKRKKKKKR